MLIKIQINKAILATAKPTRLLAMLKSVQLTEVEQQRVGDTFVRIIEEPAASK